MLKKINWNVHFWVWTVCGIINALCLLVPPFKPFSLVMTAICFIVALAVYMFALKDPPEDNPF